MVSLELNGSVRANMWPWQGYAFSLPRRKESLWRFPKYRLRSWERACSTWRTAGTTFYNDSVHWWPFHIYYTHDVFFLSLHLGTWLLLLPLLSVVHGQLIPLLLLAAEAWAGRSQAADSTAICKQTAFFSCQKVTGQRKQSSTSLRHSNKTDLH